MTMQTSELTDSNLIHVANVIELGDLQSLDSIVISKVQSVVGLDLARSDRAVIADRLRRIKLSKGLPK